MTLSVLMPAYNERATIELIVEKVLARPEVHELIIVDDGSTDGTAEIIRALVGSDDRIRVFFHEGNQGKGTATRTAIAAATGGVCIIQDADLEYDPDDYPALIGPIVEGRTKVVYGSRVLHPDNVYPFDLFRVGSYVVTQSTNALYGCRLTDEPTCYKVFETEFLKSLPLRATGFEFCPEVTAWVCKRGEEILEVPIRYSKRTVAEGKKIRWQDGVTALWTLAKVRFR